MFNNNIYKQKFDCPMDLPLSPVIADIILQDLENRALETIGVELPFYVRYIDDIAFAALPDRVNDILSSFNSYPRLQFTVERR